MGIDKIGTSFNLTKPSATKFQATEDLKSKNIFDNSFKVADSDEESLRKEEERRRTVTDEWNNSEGRQRLENGVRRVNDFIQDNGGRQIRDWATQERSTRDLCSHGKTSAICKDGEMRGRD